MTDALYRPEAVQHARSDDWMGTVRLTTTPIATAMAWVALAAVLALLGLLAFGSHVPRLAASGQVVPLGGVLQVAAPTTGHVQQLLAATGDAVTAGQPLLQLQSALGTERANGDVTGQLDREYATQLHTVQAELDNATRERATRRQALTARIALLQRQVASAEQRVQLRRRQAQSAQAMLERVQPLQREQLISAMQVQQYESNAMEARAQTELAEQDVLQLQETLAAARDEQRLLTTEADTRHEQLQRERSRIRQEATRNLAEGRTLLRAPAAGQVAAVLTDAGQLVQPGQLLLSIVPADAPMEIEVWLPVNAAGTVRPGTRVAMRVDALPYQRHGVLRGVVHEVSAAALPAEAVRRASGSEDAGPAWRVRVRTEPDQPILTHLHPGMQVNADLLLPPRRLYRLVLDPLQGVVR